MKKTPVKRKNAKTAKKAAPKATRFVVLLSELDGIKIGEVYGGLRQKLSVDPKRLGNSALRRLILEAPEDQRLAGWIYAVAKENLGKVELEFDRAMGDWVERARARIAEMKNEDEWHGTVTQSDVERVIANTFPAYREEKAKVLEAQKIERAARTLYEVFESRLSSLQTYARLLERHRGISRSEYNESQSERR